MSSYEDVMPKAKKIEKLLRDRGYDGKGMGELLRSSGNSIPVEVKKAIRYVAAIRNKLSHEHELHEFPPETILRFNECADLAIAELVKTDRTSEAKSDRRKALHAVKRPKAVERDATMSKDEIPPGTQGDEAYRRRLEEERRYQAARNLEDAESYHVRRLDILRAAAERDLDGLNNPSDELLKADLDYGPVKLEVQRQRAEKLARREQAEVLRRKKAAEDEAEALRRRKRQAEEAQRAAIEKQKAELKEEATQAAISLGVHLAGKLLKNIF
jgi:hypothetical protein